mgnify:CR=1 FL=1
MVTVAAQWRATLWPMGTFTTDWDTAPNPTYDVWTVTNGGEILPGVLSPFTATLFAELDGKGMPPLMAPYPTGKRLRLYKPPIGNFFGVSAGRLTLNVGFSVAAMSCLDPDIAAAMAAQFFQGSDDAVRLLVHAPAEEVAAALAVATAQREAAEAESLAAQRDLYTEQQSGQSEIDQALAPKAAWKRLQSLLPETIELMNRHLVVSTAAGEMQVRLAGVIAAGGGDPMAMVGLCSGLGDVESSKPALALYRLAQVAKKTAAVRTAFANGDMAAVQTGMHSGAREWQAFADEFDEFIHRYGFRVQGEADPTVADWSEEPTFVLSQVRTMMALGSAEAPAAQVKRAAAGRVALERKVRTALAPALRPVFDEAVAQAQRFTAMRELTKAVWVLGMRRLRHPILALADGLAAAGHIKSADDLEYCTYTEVGALAAGKEVADLRAAITKRKRQRRAAEDWILPNAWVGDATPTRRAEAADTKRLAGLGVSAGTATGTARIVLNTEAAFARDIEPGEILVAPFTDTPWTPLFIPAGGVVVETGGMLSHAATVAREFGIPCVVLVADATRIIRDGDTIEVDGGAGTVRIVRRARTSR